MGKYHKGIGENSIGMEKYSAKYRKTIADSYSKAIAIVLQNERQKSVRDWLKYSIGCALVREYQRRNSEVGFSTYSRKPSLVLGRLAFRLLTEFYRVITLIGLSGSALWR